MFPTLKTLLRTIFCRRVKLSSQSWKETCSISRARNGMHSHLWLQVHVEIFIWNEFWLISTWTKGEKHSSMCLYLLTCIKDTPSIWVIILEEKTIEKCIPLVQSYQVNIPNPLREKEIRLSDLSSPSTAIRASYGWGPSTLPTPLSF